MTQFHSFDGALFNEAISKKGDPQSFMRLKSSVISAIKVDPFFPNGCEADAALELLRQKCPEIFETKKELSYEVNLPEMEWDKDYFLRKTNYLRQNFCDERIQELREIGQKVYGNKLTRKTETTQHLSRGKTSVPNPAKTSVNSENKEDEKRRNPTQTPERRSGALAIALAVAVVAILVLAAVLLKRQPQKIL